MELVDPRVGDQKRGRQWWLRPFDGPVSSRESGPMILLLKLPAPWMGRWIFWRVWVLPFANWSVPSEERWEPIQGYTEWRCEKVWGWCPTRLVFFRLWALGFFLWRLHEIKIYGLVDRYASRMRSAHELNYRWVLSLIDSLDVDIRSQMMMW